MVSKNLVNSLDSNDSQYLIKIFGGLIIWCNWAKNNRIFYLHLISIIIVDWRTSQARNNYSVQTN